MEIKKKLPIYITIKLTNDEEIKSLNSNYKKRDYPTDVLSFNLDEDKGADGYFLGDIVVNVEQAERQSKDYDNSIEEEISELAAHGILHLLGVHHPEDE